jgi:hypothetical protein
MVLCVSSNISADQNEDIYDDSAIKAYKNLRIFVNKSIDIKEFVKQYNKVKDVHFWNEDLQKGFYVFFLENDDIEAVLDFRNFMESLDRDVYRLFENGENSYSSALPRPDMVNPVMVVIENNVPGKSPGYFLPKIYNKRPDLFLIGNRDEWGRYSNPPIIQAIIRGDYTTVQFFIENNINWKESRPRSRDSGSEYGLGGNVLTYLPVWDNNRRIHNYLAAQGVEEEIDISDQIIMVAYGLDSINVWSEPGYNTQIIRRINKETKLKPIRITAYKIDNCQWVYFEIKDGVRGWAPYRVCIDYDSGI